MTSRAFVSDAGTDGKGMATLQATSTSFLQTLSRGPWPKLVITRLHQALTVIVDQVASTPGAVGLILFGSYARGEFGRKSDVDLLLLTADSGIRQDFSHLVGKLESELQLPMHLALLVADPARPAELGSDLLHAIWTDGVILFGDAASLALLRPADLSPWEVVTYSGKRLTPSRRVELSRRLYGRGPQPGLVTHPAVTLGPGVVMLPPTQAQKVREALDELGASYDIFPIWRAV